MSLTKLTTDEKLYSSHYVKSDTNLTRQTILTGQKFSLKKVPDILM